MLYFNIYLFIQFQKLFLKPTFDWADNTFTCVWERGSFQDPGIQFSLGSNDGNFSIILSFTQSSWMEKNIHFD